MQSNAVRNLWHRHAAEPYRPRERVENCPSPIAKSLHSCCSIVFQSTISWSARLAKPHHHHIPVPNRNGSSGADLGVGALSAPTVTKQFKASQASPRLAGMLLPALHSPGNFHPCRINYGTSIFTAIDLSNGCITSIILGGDTFGLISCTSCM
jgi:hypothetical protein